MAGLRAVGQGPIELLCDGCSGKRESENLLWRGYNLSGACDECKAIGKVTYEVWRRSQS